MMMLTHAAISGAAGEFIGNPLIAFPFGVLLHILLDKIPHTYVKERMGNTIFKYIDPVLTIIFLIALLFLQTAHMPGLIAGALGGVSVDAWLIGVKNNKGVMGKWHVERQSHHKKMIWLLADTLIFIFGVMLIWVFK